MSLIPKFSGLSVCVCVCASVDSTTVIQDCKASTIKEACNFTTILVLNNDNIK